MSNTAQNLNPTAKPRWQIRHEELERVGREQQRHLGELVKLVTDPKWEPLDAFVDQQRETLGLPPDDAGPVTPELVPQPTTNTAAMNTAAIFDQKLADTSQSIDNEILYGRALRERIDLAAGLRPRFVGKRRVYGVPVRTFTRHAEEKLGVKIHRPKNNSHKRKIGISATDADRLGKYWKEHLGS